MWVTLPRAQHQDKVLALVSILVGRKDTMVIPGGGLILILSGLILVAWLLSGGLLSDRIIVVYGVIAGKVTEKILFDWWKRGREFAAQQATQPRPQYVFGLMIYAIMLSTMAAIWHWRFLHWHY